MFSKEEFSKAKILIIDDQKLHHLYLEKVLRDAGGFQNIRCLADPLKAYSTVLEYNPDLIVLDILLPQLDGFQIMEQLHSFRERHYLPILAVSAEQSTDFRLKALRMGATDFLHKPYENAEIIFRIRNMLEMRLMHMTVESQNRLLEEKVDERTKELKASQIEIIRRLAQAAEFRDNETGAHIIRMSHYCARLARAMGFSDQDVELILTASPLHDIGKIGIPDSILLKPAKLTVQEFEIMKTHTTIGAQLLTGASSPVMKMAQTIALSHHENWDGTGYPKGLKGEDIPLVGQICSVSDVFDALISERPYKRPWTPQQAAQEIISQKGKKFKPELVDRFELILPEFIQITQDCRNESSQ